MTTVATGIYPSPLSQHAAAAGATGSAAAAARAIGSGTVGSGPASSTDVTINSVSAAPAWWGLQESPRTC